MTVSKISHTNYISKGPLIILGYSKENVNIKDINFPMALYRLIRPLDVLRKSTSAKIFEYTYEQYKQLPSNVKVNGTFSVTVQPDEIGILERVTFRHTFYSHHSIRKLLPHDEYVFVAIAYDNQFKPFGPLECVNFYLGKIREMIETFKPDFAFGDATKLLDKTTGKDPLQYCWAYNYFSPELLEKIKRTELDKLVTLNHNWTLKELSTGGVLFQLNEPFDQDRKKEYTTYKRQAEKALKLKKLFGGKKVKPSKINRGSYGSGADTTAGYDDVFKMMFAVGKGTLTKKDYLHWLKAADKKFKGNYHDSLLVEWAEMFANSTMDEGISLRDMIFNMEVLDGSEFGERYQDQIFISASIGLSLFDDCDCANPNKHRTDCEQQQNLQTTLNFFSLAVEHLNPDIAFLGHEAELEVPGETDAHFSDFLFPLTFVSSARLLEKSVRSSQVSSPVIKAKNGIILNNFSGIFEFEGEDEFDERKKHDAELLGLQDVEMEL